MENYSDELTTTIQGQDDRISVTFQRSIDVEGYGKNQRKVSATISMDIKGDEESRATKALQVIDMIIEKVKDKVDVSAKSILVEMEGEVGRVTLGSKPKMPTASNTRPVRPSRNTGYGRKQG